MSYLIDGIDYDNIPYGSYMLNDERIYSENVRYNVAYFNKLGVRKIKLPNLGRGNIIYLLSDTFDNSLKMLNGENFIIPPNYKKVYYPWIAFGTFMGRRFRINLNSERTNRIDKIKKAGFTPYNTRTLLGVPENIFFSVSDLYESIASIIKRYPLKKIYTQFFKEFDDIIFGKMTPTPTKKKANDDWNNRILIIDADAFKFKQGAPLEDNKTNPLFLIYIAFLRTRNLDVLNLDRDLLICSKNLFLKINPTQTATSDWPRIRLALFKIMNTNLDEYVDKLSDKEKEEVTESPEENVTKEIVKNRLGVYTKEVSPSVAIALNNAVGDKLVEKAREKKQIVEHIDSALNKDDKKEEKSDTKVTAISAVKNLSNVSDKQKSLFSLLIKDYEPLAVRSGFAIEEIDDSEYEDAIKTDVDEIVSENEEVAEEILDIIQDKVAPMKELDKAPVSSARDLKLREAQKKIVVKESSIEKILERDTSNIPVEVSDKSKMMHTSNENMKQISFGNFDKTYLENVYTKDVVSCFDMLKDKKSPFYITSIDVKDSSTVLDYKETWTVKLVDENKKHHTIKVDLPKFYNNRFMLIGGNKYIILKQNMYNPLVKDTPDTVILTTNYNKITINRKDTKSTSTIEKIFTLIKRIGDNKIFMQGDSSASNKKYINSLEYDELSRRIFKFKSGNCELFFSREYIEKNMKVNGAKGNEYYIGTEGKKDIFINEDTGLDREGRTIVEIIESNLSEAHKIIFNKIKGPKVALHAQGKLVNEFVPIGVVLVVWIGLRRTLDSMGIKWNFYQNKNSIPSNTNMDTIKFADGILEYENQTFAQLILNGINRLKPEKIEFEDFSIGEPYLEYLHSIWGNHTGLFQLKHYYEFLVDPITKDVCKDLSLPDTPEGLLIHAVKLLCDNQCVNKADDRSFRIRSIEMIPSILYEEISNQYKSYIRSGRRIPLTLKPRAVIARVQAEKTVEEYSTLNPAQEMGRAYTISAKGHKGSNMEYAYDEQKRSYDKTSIGKLAISTSPDAGVGINKQLVLEPTITNVRGYRKPIEDTDSLKDVNLIAPVELLTPGTIRHDDAIRSAIGVKQSQHLMPVEGASFTLISNGFDEAIQYQLSNDFVINAEEDGEIVDINEKNGFVVVKYKSGKNFAFSTKPSIVKNSGGGFYTTNLLKSRFTKVGQKFKKDEALAYHPKFFKYSDIHGLRYVLGPLVKVAFMSTYSTYEDAGLCTDKLSNLMKTYVVFKTDAAFKRNTNIHSIVEIGDKVEIGDSLIKWDTSVEDDALSALVTKLSDRGKDLLVEESQRNIKAEHAGTVVDIKIYTLLEPDMLSPSLNKIVKEYFQKGIDKKEYLSKYDSSEGIMKTGYMLTDSTEPVVSRYGSIKQFKNIDVLIEIYIENSDTVGIGDKSVNYGPNKNIISEMIPKGYEPYSDFRLDEEISLLSAPGAISRRYLSSLIPIACANKVLIELKRKIKEEIKYKS